MIQLRDSDFSMYHYTPKGGEWVDLGHGGIVAIVIDEDHSLVDWITTDTPIETAVTLAHNVYIVVHEDYTELPVIRALIDEHELYRDCFNII